MRQVIAALAITMSPVSADAKDGPALLLTGARILDPAGDRMLEGRDVLVVGGRIAQIAPPNAVKPPDDVVPERVDLDGLALLPGLIDLHTHLLLRPYDGMKWDDQVLREALELRTIRATVFARRTVEAGFTTIRDLGTEGAGFADVAVRDAVAQGLIPGPRVYAATRAIVATGCYGPSGFDPRWDVPIGAEVADGVDGVRKAVRRQIAAGADWIKVYADYRRSAGAAATPTFSQDELNALVDEARSAGLPVAAHATIDEAIRRCVVAGVSTIEHGYAASAEIMKAMKGKPPVVLCPTLAANEAMARYDGWKPGEPDHPRIKQARELMRRALDAGVTIACGSDAGVFAHGDNAREIELMVEYGMTSAEALRAATAGAARVLGRGDDLGRIAEGCAADLIAVRGDPLKDVGALRHVVLVIREGRIVVDRRKP